MVDIAALQKYSLFGGLLPEEIDLIRPFLGKVTLKVGEAAVREGEPSDRVHFILEGRVEVCKRGVVLVELSEGDTFGEMEFLEAMPAAATVRAVKPTEAATISNHGLYELSKKSLKTYAIVVMNLARDLSRHLRRMDDLAAGEDSASSGQPPA